MLSKTILSKTNFVQPDIQGNSNRCIVGFAIIYVAAFSTLTFFYHFPFEDLFINFLSFGFALSMVAWLLVKKIQPPAAKTTFRNESLILLLLIIWTIGYITYGPELINKLLPAGLQDDAKWQFVIIIVRKLFVFVIVPYIVYRSSGFSSRDLRLPSFTKKIFSQRNIIVFVIMSAIILFLEYFLSGGSKPVREGDFTASQLFIALPLTFLWLFIEAGFVEEFFFRAILQTRLAVLLKSEWAAIFMGGLLFALAHVPGLYLRGAGSEGVTEQMPLSFWLSYCIINMSVAGIFLGIIWSRTKNLILVMSLHAMTDLLPNTADFIHTWHL
jgi:membrane protease YdiL (CAAX protease family)